MPAYDNNNIFARILRAEIPCTKVYEDEHVLAFRDIAPQAKEHLLVIPKGPYVSTQDFAENATPAEQAALMSAIGKVARLCGLADSGYRVIANTLEHGRQEVPHLHFHIVGGHLLGRMLPKD